MNSSTKYPNSLLKFLQKEELNIISKLFGGIDLNNINIENDLSKILLPIGGFLQKQLTYREILDKLLTKHKLDSNFKESVQEKEEKILHYKFKKFTQNLSSDEKIKFENEILKYAKENGINKDQAISLKAISTLSIANLSGFSIYLMASTIVGGLTSILGITLPIGFYLEMSSNRMDYRFGLYSLFI